LTADARETDAHDPEVRPASHDNERTTRDNGVEVHRVPAFAPAGNVYATPGIVPAVWRVVRGVDSAVGARPPPDVVHVHNYHAVPFVLGGLTAWLATDGRLVVTPHYHAGSDDASRDNLLTLYRPFGAATLARADRVIAVSD
jgi:glycosyltransferase involved in cell wall biosynthesis